MKTRSELNAYTRQRRKENPEHAKILDKRASRMKTMMLPDSKIANALGLTIDQCSPELIAYKRESILFGRAIRDLNKTIMEKL